MSKKFCPRCKEPLDKVYTVSEMEAVWNATEGFYVPIDSNHFLFYDKCMKCGTILKENGRKTLTSRNIKEKPLTLENKKR
jgi:hypothetical protein